MCFLVRGSRAAWHTWLAKLAGGTNRSVGSSASERTAAHEDDRVAGDGGSLFHVGDIFRGAIEKEIVVKGSCGVLRMGR